MVLARQPKSSRHSIWIWFTQCLQLGGTTKIQIISMLESTSVLFWLPSGLFSLCALSPEAWCQQDMHLYKKKTSGRVQKERTHPSCHSPVVSPFVKQASLLCFTAPVHQANGFQDFSTTISKAPFQHSLLDGFSSAHTHIPPADSSHFQVIVPLE